MMMPPSPVSSPPISVLLVDDCSIFRQGLKNWLDLCNSTQGQHYRGVGQAASVEQAIKLTVDQKPALILLDIELSHGDGIKFLSHYRRLQQPGKVLVLSGHDEDDWVFRAMQAGAQGYLLKANLSTHISSPMQNVMQEKIYVSLHITVGTVKAYLRGIFEKMEVASRTQAALKALKLGLVTV